MNNNLNNEEKPFKKRKFKITVVELFVIFIVFIIVAIYLVPQYMLTKEQIQYGRLQTNVAMMTSKVLSNFSQTESKKLPSVIAKELTD